MNQKLVSVNWHLWPWCNMNCAFCFSTFENQKEILSKQNALLVPKLLKEAGTEKITFVGGEPTLCPYLDELLIETKKYDIATKIVSNGSGLTRSFLEDLHRYIDIIGLSLDSTSNEKNQLMGRGNGNHVDNIKKVANLIHEYKISFHLNTTITKMNWQEDMHDLIKVLKPKRWKVFQVLYVEGENDLRINPYLISSKEFNFFKERHKDIPQAIFEDNNLMTGSYLMLDPIGRFFHNTNRHIQYSDAIFDVGIEKAYKQIEWNISKFIERKGIYDWFAKA